MKTHELLKEKRGGQENKGLYKGPTVWHGKC